MYCKWKFSHDFYLADCHFPIHSRGFEFVNKCLCSLYGYKRFFISENLEFARNKVLANISGFTVSVN